MSYSVRIVGPAGRETYLSARLTGKKIVFPTPVEAWDAAIEYAKLHYHIAVSVEDDRDPERQV